MGMFKGSLLRASLFRGSPVLTQSSRGVILHLRLSSRVILRLSRGVTRRLRLSSRVILRLSSNRHTLFHHNSTTPSPYMVQHRLPRLFRKMFTSYKKKKKKEYYKKKKKKWRKKKK
eukprot:TRINITY_DN3511_c0_g7_i1.p4 TRINITY_DN3511_c0_g7~~TRINITY_DN3511_c0_g7_i1.p4  ORF type:complete len:116 (+),score=30.28 TRINITY_DN3511_c0_g7_i1:488-835(+)